MLIKFSLENWMSFRDEVTFSMVASRERQHSERVPRLKKYGTNVLPIAAIYGGNASGKTNLVRALAFAKEFIVGGVQPSNLIPVEPFLLDSAMIDRPSRFSFEILADETIYEFFFATTRDSIHEEKLTIIKSTSERMLYHRLGREVSFDASLEKDMEYLNFAFRGTRDNQLFLTNSVFQRVETFRVVYEWFENSLVVIGPESRFQPFEQFFDDRSPLFTSMSERLRQLDTGIERLGSEEISFDDMSLPDFIKADLNNKLAEGMSVRLHSTQITPSVVITRTNGKLIAKKLIAYHSTNENDETRFEIHRESDGSQRVIDLIPAFIDLTTESSEKVFVIDEIDRSLHTLLTRKLLQWYLETCFKGKRTQLLFTTHDILLMDQQLLRRDEMWVTERERSGTSQIISFGEYHDVRYDKDLRKSYLQGRLGGVPHILLTSTPREQASEDSDEKSTYAS